MIVGRGGGSAEDLLAFNDERVARAIVRCKVPVISAVGHEVDVTIADLVADVRAATPSNAAELAVPDRRALLSELRNAERSLNRAAEVWLGRARLRIGRSQQRLRDPRALLRGARTRFTALDQRLHQLMRLRVRSQRARLTELQARLARLDPRLLLSQRKQRLTQLDAALRGLARPLCHEHRHRLARLAGQLDALSPLASLARGYAIVLHEPSGKALLRAADAQPGDALQVRLHEGTLRARVETS